MHPAATLKPLAGLLVGFEPVKHLAVLPLLVEELGLKPTVLPPGVLEL